MMELWWSLRGAHVVVESIKGAKAEGAVITEALAQGACRTTTGNCR